MEDKYKGLKDQFYSKMNARTNEMLYTPRVVVDEDDDDEFDMDG